MQCGNLLSATCRYFWLGAALLSTVTNLIAPPSLAAETRKRPATATPIQHVIVIIGENRTFDHVFATYRPPAGQKVDNLLSRGIIKADGTPGPNFKIATQNKAWVQGAFQINPQKKTPYTILVPTNTQGTPTAPSDAHPAPFQTIAAAQLAEPGLLASDYWMLTTGASGLAQGVIDTRIHNVKHLANGPYQLTPGVPYDAYAGSPVHRFYHVAAA